MTVISPAPRFGLTRISLPQLSATNADSLLEQLEHPYVHRTGGSSTLKIEYFKDTTDPKVAVLTTIYDDEVQFTRRVDTTVTNPKAASTTVSMDVIGPTEKKLSWDTLGKLFKSFFSQRPFQMEHTPNAPLPRPDASLKVSKL